MTLTYPAVMHAWASDEHALSCVIEREDFYSPGTALTHFVEGCALFFDVLGPSKVDQCLGLRVVPCAAAHTPVALIRSRGHLSSDGALIAPFDDRAHFRARRIAEFW